ncbi:MAG: uracil phosphoribosyltransferase [Bacteroidetes bacterium]|nr:MAG: uracil phosphoribosyltransferase [Bacteroidota bacterium]
MDSRITVIGKQNSYLNQVLYELRDENIQLDRLRFRNNLLKMGEILAYEISKHFTYTPRQVRTQLGTLEMNLLSEQPVLVSILRAGLSLHEGLLKFFDQADNGFISAFRHHTNGNQFIVKVQYQAAPDISGRDLILIDPMIATGKSAVLCHQALVESSGQPERVFIAGVIASDEGLEYVLRHIPKARIFVGAVDYELTAKAYIVPGLGDAGDLAFGPKDDHD